MILGLGGANAISAGFRVYLNDEFSQNAKRITETLKGMKNQTSQLREELMGAKRMYTGLATAAWGATAGMVRLAMRGAEYKFEMTKVKAITKGAVAEMKKLDNIAKQLAADTIFRPTEIASAMKFAAMTGQSASTIRNTISPATYLAGATDTQLGGKGGAMDIQTNIMRAFDIADSRMMEVADLLTAATLSANTNLTDLGRAIKYTAATSMDLGTGLKETTAMVMMLGNAGMQGSQAGTAVENMQRYFSRAEGSFSTKAQQEAMGMLGYTKKDFLDKSGNLKDWATIFSMISKGSEKLSSVEKQSAYEKLFGVRGKRAGSVFARMSGSEGDYNSMLDALNNSPGMAKSISGEMMDNLKGSWERLISEFDSFAASWSEAVSPLLRGIMWFAKGILKGANAIISTPVLGTLVSSLVLLGSTAMALRWSFKALAMTIATISGPRASLGGMRGAANGWIRGAFSSMGMGRSYETAGRATYSSKRGMFYTIGSSGGAKANPRTVKFNHAAFNQAGMMGGFGKLKGLGSLGKIGKYLGMGVKFLGRMIPYLGPILIALEIFGPLLQDLGGYIVDLVRGTDDNTRALVAQYDLYKGSNITPAQAFMSAYKDTTAEEINKEIVPIIKALLAEGKTREEIIENGLLNIYDAQANNVYTPNSDNNR